ncbi:Pre-mRNA-splicing factor ATP-dependent RNA helicase PRP16, partial [Quaeritorhiza haematococci]
MPDPPESSTKYTVSRLEGSTPQQGGLIFRKPKKNDSGTGDDATAPKTSLLGLDRLAAEKRAEAAAQAEHAAKRIKLTSTSDQWDQDDESSADFEIRKSSSSHSAPRYRDHSRRMDTPSVGTGLTDEARSRLSEHRNREREKYKEGGLYRSSSSRDRDRREDLDEGVFKRPLPPSRSRYDRDRNDRSDRYRSERDRYDRERDYRSSSSRPPTSSSSSTSRRSEWDETPSHRSSKWSSSSSSMRSGPGGITPRRPTTSTTSNGNMTSRRGTSSGWDDATPRVKVTTYDDGVRDGKRRDRNNDDEPEDEEYGVWEEEQLRLDRDWYNLEESGAMDETHNQFTEFEDYWKKKEEQFTKQQAKRMTARQAQYNRDNDLWETNRMLTSGVVQRAESSMDFDEEDETRVHILVRDLRPPFLDGKMVFTKQLDPISPVLDPTSDLAVFSRKGSRLVREKREQQERAKASKSWELAGTALGNIMGVTKKVNQGDGPPGDPNAPESPTDAKGDSQFASHLKDRSDAVSAFARSKTIREQREYLPVFAVREELLSVVRDNQ